MRIRKNICILACSPRAHGNTDAMAHTFAQGIRSAGGSAEILFLREYHTLPCSACYKCRDNARSTCVFSKDDDTAMLYDALRAAPLVFLAAPIFFYHLPAQLKAFIDRAHALWVQQEKYASSLSAASKGNPKDTYLAPAFVGLVAGKRHGEKLFEGSLLTLRYFFHTLDMHIHTSHLIRGCDTQEDFAADTNTCEYVHTLGVKAQALVDAEKHTPSKPAHLP